MKKLALLFSIVVFGLVLVACGGTTTAAPTTAAPTTAAPQLLENTAKDYYLTGNWNGWDTKEDAVMEAIYLADERVASIADELEDVKYLYVLELFLPSDDAGWTVNYIVDEENIQFNGNQTVKVIRTLAGDPDTRDWWAQSPESGEILNLTPDTLFIPPFIENATTTFVDDMDTVEDTEDDVTYTTGAWNDNPVALEAGSYLAVFAEFEDGSKGLGLISTALVNTAKDYYVTGQFNGWDTKADGQMMAAGLNHPALAELDLDGAKYIYALQIVLPAEDAGWTVNYIVDEENVQFNGNQTVKVIRTLAGDPDSRDWWAQSPESGEILNLTPETLFMPPFIENATTTFVDDMDTVEDTTDDVTYTTGAWNDNPVALEAGTYVAVFVEFENGTKGLALVPVVVPEA